MFVFSTCRDCGGLLHVTGSNTVHPECTPKPTKAQRLALEWVAAAEAGDTDREHQLHTRIDQLDSQPPRLLDAALIYAEYGWPVFPLWPKSHKIGVDRQTGENILANGKTPATNHGFKDATNNQDRIRRWWDKHPHCNIGLPTGHAFDIVDIDVPDGAFTYHQLLEADALPDSHGMVATASGGIHHYIPAASGGNLAGVLPGVDYRGAGGYCVAPPSTLGEHGRAWSWTVHPSPVLTGGR